MNDDDTSAPNEGGILGAYQLALAPQHDIDGTKTLAGGLMKATGYRIPTLPPHDAAASREISQLQFEQYLYSILSGMGPRRSAIAAGINPKAWSAYMKRGHKDTHAGYSETRHAVFAIHTGICEGVHQQYLLSMLHKHTLNNRDPKALIYAMKLAGFEKEDKADTNVDEIDESDTIINALLGSLPQVQS